MRARSEMGLPAPPPPGGKPGSALPARVGLQPSFVALGMPPLPPSSWGALSPPTGPSQVSKGELASSLVAVLPAGLESPQALEDPIIMSHSDRASRGLSQARPLVAALALALLSPAYASPEPPAPKGKTTSRRI